jgi:hypothetical protein
LEGVGGGVLVFHPTNNRYIYILSKTLIPNKDNPNFSVFAVKSHNINREVLAGSSDLRTGQFS